MAYQHILPADTKLIGEFQILAHLGSGGFANTYHALELSLGREVAIKEYFPSDLAVRVDDMHVQAKTPSDEKHFKWGLRRFIREAKTLAKFHHPSVVRVARVFQENDTAYIVMEFVSGSNMDAWLQSLGRPPTQAECDRFLPPILDALEVVHSAGILHRDIKPANIYIRAADNSPVLLDFGSARHAAAEQAGTTAAIVSKGYSPHEAYTTDTKQQGPWTDIYALAATMYRALSGQAPPESTSRILEDTYTSPKLLAVTQAGYRREFLDAIDQALNVLPKDRPQSISDWRRQLFPSLPATTIFEGHTQALPTTKIWKPISDRPTTSPSVTSRRATRPGLLRTRNLVFGIGLLLSFIGASAFYLGLNPKTYDYVQELLNLKQKAKVVPSPKDVAQKKDIATPPPSSQPENKESQSEAIKPQKTTTVSIPPIHDCDRLAGQPDDQARMSDGVELNQIQADKAISVCQSALETYPGTARFEHQLGRAFVSKESYSRALPHFQRAADKDYGAALGFLGFMYQWGLGVNKDLVEANRWFRKAVNKDNPSAMNALAVNLQNGAGISKDVTEANSWYRKAANKGVARAMYNLGVNLQNGTGIARDVREANSWYQKAIDKGDVEAMFHLGVNLQFGAGITKDVEEANRWYRKAADKGMVRAMYNLAVNLRSGNGINKDITEANRWFRKAAEKGMARAMNNLAVNLETGTGIDKDIAEANRWYRKAADKGDADAMCNLAVNLESGRGITKDVTEANSWYRKAADKGMVRAMYNLAVNLQKGTGITKDVTEANSWYRKAADKGNADAMFHLAVNLQFGAGITKDISEANRWYRKAADKDVVRAMYNLAVNLQNGTGITKDVKEANNWYRKAADKGMALAMYNLAVNLQTGTGVDKDVEEANRWYRKAADKGYAKAMYSLAVTYDRGMGVAKDRREAARFMVAALKKADTFAVKEMTTNSDGWSKEFRRELQRSMHDAGVYDGAIDGSFGQSTSQAIEALAKK